MKFVDEAIHDYSVLKSSRPSALANELEQYTRKNITHSQMLVGKLEASFLQFLIHAIEAKHILEIGTYTGYSALCMAEALPVGGTVTTLDIDPENGKVARSFWDRSPSSTSIQQIIGPATQTLSSLPGPFDLVFIDADKENYLNYAEATLPKLSEKGILVLDNVLWSGSVIDLNDQRPSTQAIRKVNDYFQERRDVHVTLLPVRDGILLVKVKK